MVATLWAYNTPWITYCIQKKIMTPTELINFYTSKSFSNEMEIVNLEFGKDTQNVPKGVYYKDEYLKAELLVPVQEIDILFPTKSRIYDKSFSIFERESENIDFSVFQASRVERRDESTQRTIHYTIMKPKEQKVKIFIFIDKLGWK